ncbi:sporulation membrane protein YtaF [Bacillus sp. FJAT-42315]|uniref:sporulation membrane protein YtaF n=1 Tax=Bacillus sp. FJAT-42315 TaxID=2014077 RepID=UPI000C241A54|nr:sporulation membrane protein YtaF [Bacillus sp. FJAT-42315]
MSAYLSLYMLAVAVSLDSFSAGLAYGLKRLKLPMKSSIVLSLCSAGSLLVAMMTGHILSRFISEQTASQIGGFILIGLGAWVLWQFFRADHKSDQLEDQPLVYLEFKRLGIVIQILKSPAAADLDKSGTISGMEAVLLGLALSLDSFGAGIGAALLGFSPFILAASVAGMNFLFVTSGLWCGRKFANVQWIQRVAFLPGILLIILGTFKM